MSALDAVDLIVFSIVAFLLLGKFLPSSFSFRRRREMSDADIEAMCKRLFALPPDGEEKRS